MTSQWYAEAILEVKRTNTPHLEDKNFLMSPTWVYLVKWAGFQDAKATWEPIQNLMSCERLIKSLWNHLGHETFLTDVSMEGQQFRTLDHWIREEKLIFRNMVPRGEVTRQNKNPKRKRSASDSSPRTPAPSFPRQINDNGSPRRVTFGSYTDVSVVPPISEAENPAQRDSTPIAEDSEDEDDIPLIALASTSPHRGRITARRIAEDSEDEDDISLTAIANTSPPRGRSTHRRIADNIPTADPSPTTSHIPQAIDAPGPLPDAQHSRDYLFSPPPALSRSKSRGIRIFETAVSPGSQLATKQRLAKAPVAPGIPRASPVPDIATQPAAAVIEAPAAPPVDDAMDVGSGPTLVSDVSACTDGDVTNEIGPLLASMAPYTQEQFDAGAGGTGLYTANEDRYAGLPKNGDSMDIDMDFGGQGDGGEPFDVGGSSLDSQVDQFLNTLDLPAPSRPPMHDYRPTQPVRPPVPIAQWTWNGRLTITVRGVSQTVCEHASLTDVTEASVPNKPRIGSFVKLSDNHLNFPVFYGIHDLLMVLPACQPAQQFARLTAEGPDTESFKLLARYIAREEQAVVLRALWDDDEIVGYLMFFAPTILAHHLDVPAHLLTPDCLIAALLYKTETIPPFRIHHKRFPCLAPATLSREQWSKSLRQEPAYHISLRIVNLPEHVQRRAYKQASVVWFKRAPGDEQDKDTEHLLRVLKKSKVGVTSPRDPAAELVFVHIAAIKNIHNLPLLAQRRLRPDVWFCSYGTDWAEPLNRWGFHEIYLLGGVVTFTPEALVRDAWGVLRTIRNIHSHPLWICHLLPQVVGMAMRLNQEHESLQDYMGSLPLALDHIVDAIVDGQVALACAPPMNDMKEWALEHAIFAPLTKDAVLEYCTKSFDEVYVLPLQSTWGTLVQNDVLANMRRMQVRPAIVSRYRRYIVLDASSTLKKHDGEDGIEWIAVGNFGFNDDFLKCQELAW